MGHWQASQQQREQHIKEQEHDALAASLIASNHSNNSSDGSRGGVQQSTEVCNDSPAADALLLRAALMKVRGDVGAAPLPSNSAPPLYADSLLPLLVPPRFTSGVGGGGSSCASSLFVSAAAAPPRPGAVSNAPPTPRLQLADGASWPLSRALRGTSHSGEGVSHGASGQNSGGSSGGVSSGGAPKHSAIVLALELAAAQALAAAYRVSLCYTVRISHANTGLTLPPLLPTRTAVSDVTPLLASCGLSPPFEQTMAQLTRAYRDVARSRLHAGGGRHVDRRSASQQQRIPTLLQPQQQPVAISVAVSNGATPPTSLITSQQQLLLVRRSPPSPTSSRTAPTSEMPSAVLTEGAAGLGSKRHTILSSSSSSSSSRGWGVGDVGGRDRPSAGDDGSVFDAAELSIDEGELPGPSSKRSRFLEVSAAPSASAATKTVGAAEAPSVMMDVDDETGFIALQPIAAEPEPPQQQHQLQQHLDLPPPPQPKPVALPLPHPPPSHSVMAVPVPTAPTATAAAATAAVTITTSTGIATAPPILDRTNSYPKMHAVVPLPPLRAKTLGIQLTVMEMEEFGTAARFLVGAMGKWVMAPCGTADGSRVLSRAAPVDALRLTMPGTYFEQLCTLMKAEHYFSLVPGLYRMKVKKGNGGMVFYAIASPPTDTPQPAVNAVPREAAAATIAPTAITAPSPTPTAAAAVTVTSTATTAPTHTASGPSIIPAEGTRIGKGDGDDGGGGSGDDDGWSDRSLDAQDEDEDGDDDDDVTLLETDSTSFTSHSRGILAVSSTTTTASAHSGITLPPALLVKRDRMLRRLNALRGGVAGAPADAATAAVGGAATAGATAVSSTGVPSSSTSSSELTGRSLPVSLPQSVGIPLLAPPSTTCSSDPGVAVAPSSSSTRPGSSISSTPACPASDCFALVIRVLTTTPSRAPKTTHSASAPSSTSAAAAGSRVGGGRTRTALEAANDSVIGQALAAVALRGGLLTGLSFSGNAALRGDVVRWARHRRALALQQLWAAEDRQQQQRHMQQQHHQPHQPGKHKNKGGRASTSLSTAVAAVPRLATSPSSPESVMRWCLLLRLAAAEHADSALSVDGSAPATSTASGASSGVNSQGRVAEAAGAIIFKQSTSREISPRAAAASVIHSFLADRASSAAPRTSLQAAALAAVAAAGDSLLVRCAALRAMSQSGAGVAALVSVALDGVVSECRGRGGGDGSGGWGAVHMMLCAMRILWDAGHTVLALQWLRCWLGIDQAASTPAEVGGGGVWGWGRGTETPRMSHLPLRSPATRTPGLPFAFPQLPTRGCCTCISSLRGRAPFPRMKTSGCLAQPRCARCRPLTLRRSSAPSSRLHIIQRCGSERSR